MNKVFKVIWSEARNAYVVVSEIAKNHGSKSCSTKKLLTMLIATGVMTCASMAPAMADNPAPNDLNVTIGKGAHVSVWNGVSGQTISGDIAVGPNAHAWNGEYTYDDKYARIGTKEYLLDFGQGAVEKVTDWKYIFPLTHYKVKDGSKIAGSIAIGKNTIARTGSVMLGDHSYTGKLGDIEINPANAMTYNDGIYSTTLGAGAYNSGSLAAVTGALSIASGKDTKNTGATIYGSMNNIESATSDSEYSGVASSVLGFANKTQNANAALIWGTGNEVTNSVEKIGIDTDWNNVSVAEAQQKAIEAMQSSKYAGGSVLAIGGGNKADYATYSQLTGVQNKVTGTKDKAAKYDFVNGYKNTVTSASDVTVIGIKNEVTADGNKVIGDNHKVSGKNNVIFGSADQLTETTVNNSVALGHNAKVTGEGGVALGFGSVADRGNAVSVGSKGAERQIINVKAGVEDTDAVNVSQLKKATANANKGWKLYTEGGAANQVASEATVDFSGDKNISVSNDGTKVKVKLNKDLQGIESVSNGAVRLALSGATGTAGLINGKGASVFLMDDSTVINGVVGIDKTGKISSVANGEISATSKDAVNGSQLYDVKNSINTDISNKTFGLEDDNGNALKQKLDNTIKVKGADGITSTVNDGALEIGLKLQNNSNLVVDSNGLALNTALTGIQSITGAGEGAGSISFANGGNVNINNITFNNDGRIQNVADGKDTKDAVNVGQLNKVSEVANKGWKVSTNDGTATDVKPGDTVDFAGEDNIVVSNTDKKVVVKLGKDLTGLNSVTTKNAYVTSVDASKGDSVTNVDYVKQQIAGAALSEGNGISITDKKINVKLKDGEENLVVNSDGLALNTALTGIQSITGVGDGKISFATGGNVNINNITFNNDGRIQNVADGKDTKDAVNVGQLNAVKETANKGWNLSTGKGEAVNVKPGETVDFSGDDNIKVSNTGKDVKVELEKDLTGIESISNGGVKLALNGAGGTAGLINGKGASVFLMNDSTVINGVVGIDKNGKITNVAAGTAATDAVNVSQLNKVATEAGKHTQVKAGTNVGVVPSETDGTNVYTVNADGTTVSGDSNVVVTAGAKDANNVTNYGVKLNKDLKGIESVSNGAAKLTLSSHPLFGATAELTNGKASVELKDSTTIINGKVQVRQDGSIGGVTAGRVDNDAVNLGQLKDVKAEALKHTTLSDGKNTTVEATVKDGQTDYKVNVAGDLTDITSVINGGAKLALNGEAGVAGLINGKGASVYLQDGYTKINNKVSIDQDGKISGVAAGTADTDAVNVSQLKKVSDTANAGWTLSTNGNATAGTKVTPGALVDFSGDNNVSVSNKGTAVSVKLNNALQDIESISNGDAKLALNGAAGTAGIINGQGASVYMQGSTTVINNKVSVDKDGKISGVAAGKISADSTDAVNGSQLNAVATEAGKHSKVVNGTNTNVEESTVDGQKVYKVNLNDNIMVGDVTGRYVSISGTNGTIEATGAIATKDRVYADKGGKLADIDVTGNTISNGDAKLALNGAAGTAGIINGQGASVYMQGSTTVINSKVSVDKDGKISGVAAGTADTDAVNVSQLKKVSDTANAGWNLSTNGAATEATNVKPGDNVDFSGDKNISVSNDGTKVKVELNKNLKDIESISNGDAKLTLGAMGGMVSEFANGQGASVKLFGDITTINGKVNVYKDGRIAGVADGVNANDAVNVSQLKKVSDTANAGWNLSTNGAATEATNVKPGDNVDFSGDKNISVSNDGTKVKVELNKNLKDIESISNGGASLTLGAMGGMVSEFANGQGASVKLFGDTTIINGKVTVYKDGRIAGVADGVNANDAVNVSQLQKAAAASATTVSDGVNTTVTATKAEDGHTDYKVNLNKDLVGIESISNAGASLTMNGIATELANGQGASVKLFGDTTTINNAVTVYKDGRISGVAGRCKRQLQPNHH